MRCIYSLLGLFLLSHVTFAATIHVPADQPTIEWEQLYGFDGVRDYGKAALQCNDSSYVFLGRTLDSMLNTNDILLVKTDSLGNMEWANTYGEPAFEEIGYDILQTDDDGFIICGETTAMGNGWDIFIIRLNPHGDTLWTRVYGNLSTEKAYGIVQCHDGGFCFTGLAQRASNNNAYLTKINASGNHEWTTYIEPSNQYTTGEDLVTCNDGGYVVAGSIDTSGLGVQNVLLAKFDFTGEYQWQKQYGASEWVGSGRGLDVVIVPDAGFATCGYKYVSDTTTKAWIIKVDEAGDLDGITFMEIP